MPDLEPVRAARAAYVAASAAYDEYDPNSPHEAETDRALDAAVIRALDTYVRAACAAAAEIGATGAYYPEEEDLLAAVGVDLDDAGDEYLGEIVVAYDLALARHDARLLTPHDARERSARAYGTYLACEALAREAREAAEETGTPTDAARAYRAAREAAEHACRAYRSYAHEALLVASVAIRP